MFAIMQINSIERVHSRISQVELATRQVTSGPASISLGQDGECPVQYSATFIHNQRNSCEECTRSSEDITRAIGRTTNERLIIV